MKETEYLARIQEHFPHVAYTHARLITKGWDNDVVILDERIVFRFPKRDAYRARFRAEVRLLARLAPLMPVRIPMYQYLPPDQSFGGYTMIPGEEMSVDVFQKFSESEKATIAKQLGECLSVIHATPVAYAQECGFEEEEGGYWWSKEHTMRTLVGLRAKVFPKLESSEIDWIEKQFERYLACSFEFARTVVHSDFVDDHIFVDTKEGLVTGIIDFADVEIADPALDFSWFWKCGPDFPEKVLSHYTGVVDKDFLARSKFPILMHMVGNMLEMEEGAELPVTHEQSRQELLAVMRSGISL